MTSLSTKSYFRYEMLILDRYRHFSPPTLPQRSLQKGTLIFPAIFSYTAFLQKLHFPVRNLSECHVLQSLNMPLLLLFVSYTSGLGVPKLLLFLWLRDYTENNRENALYPKFVHTSILGLQPATLNT